MIFLCVFHMVGENVSINRKCQERLSMMTREILREVFGFVWSLFFIIDKWDEEVQGDEEEIA